MTRTLALLFTLILPATVFAADPYSGRWVGQWSSDSNGHRGPLRATLSPTATGYDARFAGRFAVVVPFVYRTHLETVGTSGESVFLAAERRIPLFGNFRTDVVVTPWGFDATFRSGRDSGRFTLTR
jgi:hypothetical protein